MICLHCFRPFGSRGGREWETRADGRTEMMPLHGKGRQMCSPTLIWPTQQALGVLLTKQSPTPLARGPTSASATACLPSSGLRVHMPADQAVAGEHPLGPSGPDWDPQDALIISQPPSFPPLPSPHHGNLSSVHPEDWENQLPTGPGL